MKTILFIAPSNSIHSKKWIDSQLDSGFNIVWFSFFKKTINMDSRITYKEFNSSNVFIFSFSILFCFLQIRKLGNPLIHFHSLGRHLPLILLLSNKRHLIVSPWGSDIRFVNPLSFHGFFLKRGLTKSSLITVDADFMFSEVCKFSNELLTKLIRINFGTDVSTFDYKSNYIISANNISIVSLRNLEPIYDLETLIKAVKILTNNYPELIVNCSIFGSGSQENYLKNLVSELNLNNCITFNGKFEYQLLPNILKSFDIYVSTSKSDAGLAGSTSEAMASGLPVVISDNSENSFWIDNDSGFLFSTSSPNDLAEKIMFVSKLPLEILEKFRMNGRKKISVFNNFELEMKKMSVYYSRNL